MKGRNAAATIRAEVLAGVFEPGTDASLFPLMRLLAPELDVRRKYGLQLAALTDLFINALGLSGKDNEGNAAVECLRGFCDAGVAARHPNIVVRPGDFGETIRGVLEYRGLATRRPPGDPGDLTVGWANEELDKLCKARGAAARAAIAKAWLKDCTAEECKWLARIILKKLRMGFGYKAALKLYHKDAKTMIDSMSLEKLCEAVGFEDGKNYNATVGLLRPFAPMVGKSVACMSGQVNWHTKLLKKLPGDVAVEEKLDGERLIVHFKRTGKHTFDFRAFTRRKNDFTNSYAALKDYLAKGIDAGVQECILDGELMVWDSKTRAYGAFGSNKAVANTQLGAASSPSKWLCYVTFDIVYKDGMSLTGKRLCDRKRILDSVVVEIETKLEIAPYVVASHSLAPEKRWKVIWDHFLEVHKKRGEGVMIKRLDAAYWMGESYRDKGNWWKIKPDYMDSASDTIDVVVIGAFYGRGDLRKDLVGKFLVAVRDGDGKECQYKAVTRVGTGFNRQQLARIWKLMSICKCPQGACTKGCKFVNTGLSNVKKKASRFEFPQHVAPWRIANDDVPDVVVKDPRNSVVLEVLCFEVTKSDTFACGYNLRFPRLKAIREDKACNQATTVKQLKEIFHAGAHKNISSFGSVPRGIRRRLQAERSEKQLSIVDHLMPLELGHVVQTSNVLSGMHVRVIRDDYVGFYPEIVSKGAPARRRTHPHLEFAEYIKAHGANLVHSEKTQGGSCAVVVVGNVATPQAKSKVKHAEFDILSASYLERCIRAGKCMEPRWFDRVKWSKETLDKYGRDLDEFQDSYTDPAAPRVLSILYSRVKHPILEDAHRIRQLHYQQDDDDPLLLQGKSSIMRGCVAYSPDASYAPVNASLLLCTLHGGQVVDYLSCSVTHVVLRRRAMGKERACALVASLNRIREGSSVNCKRIVSHEWIGECIALGLRWQAVSPKDYDMHEVVYM